MRQKRQVGLQLDLLTVAVDEEVVIWKKREAPLGRNSSDGTRPADLGLCWH